MKYLLVFLFFYVFSFSQEKVLFITNKKVKETPVIVNQGDKVSIKTTNKKNKKLKGELTITEDNKLLIIRKNKKTTVEINEIKSISLGGVNWLKTASKNLIRSEEDEDEGFSFVSDKKDYKSKKYNYQIIYEEEIDNYLDKYLEDY